MVKRRVLQTTLTRKSGAANNRACGIEETNYILVKLLARQTSSTYSDDLSDDVSYHDERTVQTAPYGPFKGYIVLVDVILV